MGLCYHSPVFRDVCKLILLIFEYNKDLPKEYKYTLGQDLKRAGINVVYSVYRANKAQNKKEYLEAFLDDLELLKLEVPYVVEGFLRYKPL